MWQQARFFEHSLSRCKQIVRSRGKTHFAKCFPSSFVTQFWFFTECKECLFAAHLLAMTSNIEHFLNRHVGCFDLAWNRREGAIVTNIPTQMREWYEYFFGVCDDVVESTVSQHLGNVCEFTGVVTICEG